MKPNEALGPNRGFLYARQAPHQLSDMGEGMCAHICMYEHVLMYTYVQMSTLSTYLFDRGSSQWPENLLFWVGWLSSKLLKGPVSTAQKVKGTYSHAWLLYTDSAGLKFSSLASQQVLTPWGVSPVSFFLQRENVISLCIMKDLTYRTINT